MHEDIAAAIRELSAARASGEAPLIGLEAVRRLAAESGLSPLEIERAALECGVLPARYRLNMGSIGVHGQLRLLRSRVGICGLGGLGGHVAEALARFGVGHLILADADVFEESNLNRQALCTEAALGRPKAEVAVERIGAINSSLEVTAHRRYVGADDAREVFAGADLVVDALDNVPSRLALERACAELGIPLVHGAISGECGQVMTVFPGDAGLSAIYGDGDACVAAPQGNPPPTPALVASLQAAEAVKVICGGEPLRHGFLLLDTAANLYEFIPLK